MIGYGSVARPYQEHPAEPIQAVHWGGHTAVKWNYSQFMYRNGGLAVGNSPVGTMSVWLKFHPDSATMAPSMSLLYSAWLNYQVTTRSDFSTVVDSTTTPVTRAYHKFKFSPTSAEAFFAPPTPNTYAYLIDTGSAFPSTGAWYHLFAQWNTSTGTLVLKVNGVTIASPVYGGDTVKLAPSDLGFPFDVSWSYPTADDLSPNSSQFLSNANLDDGLPSGFSIAEYWLDTTAPTALTVDKFVDLTTGRPKPLGTAGTVPTGSAPAFFFARSGAPQTFVANRGSGGTFTFARGHYSLPGGFTSVDIPDPATDPPLDEPDNPHYTPATALAA